jgi:hypothetical protein
LTPCNLKGGYPIFEETFCLLLQDPSEDSENVVDQGCPKCGPIEKIFAALSDRNSFSDTIKQTKYIGLQSTIWRATVLTNKMFRNYNSSLIRQ